MVPTEYYSRYGSVTETHQYSVSEYSAPLAKETGKQPSIDLTYDLSPIVVAINERPPSFLHFLVRISAVVGGAFAVTSEWDGGALGGRGGGLCCHKYMGGGALGGGGGLLPSQVSGLGEWGGRGP